jgi:hypothetical protein
MIANQIALDRVYLANWCDELNIRKLFEELWSECQNFGNA